MFFPKILGRGWSHVSHLRAQHSVKIAVCLPQIESAIIWLADLDPLQLTLLVFQTTMAFPRPQIAVDCVLIAGR
jgi:hypothetical protein